jgi:hypothetical protein
MSNLLTPLDLHALDMVTGGITAGPRCSSSDPLLQTLNSLSSTLQNVGSAAHQSGFSPTTIMMLGLLMSQRSAVNVFVRRPFW